MLKIFFLVLLVPSICFGKAYYVDPTYDGLNGRSNGSFERPWTNMSGQVRAHSFETGDRLYFRAGTRTVMNEPLYIRWNGNEQNRVVIGTYFGEENFGNGDVHPSQRPILDGSNFLIPNNNNTAMIQSLNRPGYVTIQDLEIRDSGGMGISVGNTYQGGSASDYPYINHNYLIRNVFVNRSWTSAIGVARSSHNQVLNNIVYRSSHGHFRTHPHRGTNERISGAGIEITGMHIYGVSEWNTVSGNTVSTSSYEGIGFYKRSRYGKLINNTIYDCSVNIYIASSSDIEVSGNLVYSTPTAYRGANNTRNILLQHEHMDYGHFPIQSRIENVKVFNNFIAGGSLGIGVSVYEGVEWGWRNVEIYNNVMVNNRDNFGFWNVTVGEWQNNYIYGNFSFQYETADGQHTRMDSPYSFKWNRDKKNYLVPNHFTGNKIPNGNAGQGASLNNAHLAKMSGWRDLSPGEVTLKNFSLEGGAGTAYIINQIIERNIESNITKEEQQELPPKKVKNIVVLEGDVVN